MMIPAPAERVCPTWDAARATDPVVQRCRALFARLDGSAVTERDPRRPWPGPAPHPTAAYVKALVVKLGEGKADVTELRAFLLAPPLLVRELGFRPVVDPTQPWGFDVARTVPGARWRRPQQRHLDHPLRRRLLAGTVAALRAAVPELGATIAVDIKHLYAWVRENNPRAEVPHRFDPARPPRGDRDGRLGAKRLVNQDGPPGARVPAKEYLWGDGTGLAAATDPRGGDVVPAEVTRPCNDQDVEHFPPLSRQAAAALGRRPTNLAADAAFDAWHVYQACAEAGGIAAIPRNRRGPAPARTADGHPVCDRGLAMTPTSQFVPEDGFRAQRDRCPLRRPVRTGQACDDPRFASGPGCTKYPNIEPGGLMRANLDRHRDADRRVYRQRTAAERINSQAKALGIERPKVRTAAAVHRRNTLTYLVFNARALARRPARTAARARLTQHPPPPLC